MTRPIPREGAAGHPAHTKRDTSRNGTGKKRGAYRTDEQTAIVLSALSEPFERQISDIAQEAGISKDAAAKLVQRLRKRGIPLHRLLGDVSRKETQQLFALRTHQILLSITEEEIAKASLKDKAIATGIFTEKELLLSGQPTEILSVPQLENLDHLAAAVLKEATRRGISLQTDPRTQVVTALPANRRAGKDPQGPIPDPEQQPR